ncbi:hypothetical protein LEP1GSC124_2712 [Leptospira interrogans serovar Pyrogenes str. 200701872]|uniref:Uncharacterized protein n=2 Tax=Leptospira interrogans TaxID=173 RepID=M7A1U9_LEPIR|nr:hypothetical protein LEP1GSC150_4321 [Leptospira interrogans serovar Copenhageni str. LT2050]EMP04719.1 hypothetical protein LEP1GSC124_2712 [Leptospira interrogans serovar Pyrogenes str. 200701872]
MKTNEENFMKSATEITKEFYEAFQKKTPQRWEHFIPIL